MAPLCRIYIAHSIHVTINPIYHNTWADPSHLKLHLSPQRYTCSSAWWDNYLYSPTTSRYLRCRPDRFLFWLIPWNMPKTFSLRTSLPAAMLKTGFRGYSDFGFRILRDLASTYVLRRPCSSSLYFGISRSSGWLDLVVNEERNLSWFQNWRIAYMNKGLIY